MIVFQYERRLIRFATNYKVIALSIVIGNGMIL